MADPKDLQEAAEAIHQVRGLAAVQRHKELDEPLRQAEEWARNEYRKVREENGDRRHQAPGGHHESAGAAESARIRGAFLHHDTADFDRQAHDVFRITGDRSHPASVEVS